jgi:hypothetical protein
MTVTSEEKHGHFIIDETVVFPTITTAAGRPRTCTILDIKFKRETFTDHRNISM